MQRYVRNEIILTLKPEPEESDKKTQYHFLAEEVRYQFNGSIPHYFNERTEKSLAQTFDIKEIDEILLPHEPSIYRVFIPAADLKVDEVYRPLRRDVGKSKCQSFFEAASHYFDEEECACNMSRTYKVTFEKEVDVVELSNQLLERKDLVQSVHPNYFAESCSCPPTLDFSPPWWLKAIKLEEAWDKWASLASVNNPCPEVLIAVIDSGIKGNHPAFQGRIKKSCDFVHYDKKKGRLKIVSEDYKDPDEDPDDDNGHGTHCAGIAAASPREVPRPPGNKYIEGITGVCPWAGILPVRALFSVQEGEAVKATGTALDISVAIKYAVDRKARVISLSLASPQPAFECAVKYAYKKGACIIAAMGNRINKRKRYPAAHDHVLAVGSIAERTNGELESYRHSNSGYKEFPGFVVAPGVAIVSTFISEKGYKKITGTSMATPFVAGLAALIISLDLSHNPEPTLGVDEIYNLIRENTTFEDGYERDRWGKGLINVEKTLQKTWEKLKKDEPT